MAVWKPHIWLNKGNVPTIQVRNDGMTEYTCNGKCGYDLHR